MVRISIPLLTLPASGGSTVGTVAPSYGGQTGGSGWLGKRVYSLEEKVAKIYQKHEADEAREKAAREAEERTKREKDAEERRVRKKNEREDFQKSMKKKLSESLDKVYKAIDGKKSTEGDKMGKLKATIHDMQRRLHVTGTSSDTVAQVSEVDELSWLRREQVEMKIAADKRLSSLEDVVLALQRQREDAKANAEKWKSEALRPSNKRGSIAIEPTPTTNAKWWARTTPLGTPKRHIEADLKGIVERHHMEVEALQALRISEMNARKESEAEIDRLKESLVRLKMVQRTGTRGTDLKSKLDEAAGKNDNAVNEPASSARKGKKKAVSWSVSKTVDKDVFVLANRRNLRGKNKDAIMTICKNEGVVYTTLEGTKEAIVQARMAKTFNGDGGKNNKGKASVPVEVSEDGDESSVKTTHDDLTLS
ncbi:hypothetical protein CBR_g34689 [Chara braunii]|uniref:Uncharacterized protein n=1 Tax=Chara braunii TaxID=69332 RepID=A0A388JYV1_CHABU|nr:hypothetical protein CBR_g34689 [Chara braunii]|eukprot:GBG62989.1 hypothetical protein CBR_g34689 [Chara braunii]